MNLTEILQTSSQYGLPVISLVLLIWKGIPKMIQYVDDKTEQHEKRVDEMVAKHETRMTALVNDYKEHTDRTNQRLDDIASKMPKVEQIGQLIDRLNEGRN